MPELKEAARTLTELRLRIRKAYNEGVKKIRTLAVARERERQRLEREL